MSRRSHIKRAKTLRKRLLRNDGSSGVCLAARTWLVDPGYWLPWISTGIKAKKRHLANAIRSAYRGK